MHRKRGAVSSFLTRFCSETTLHGFNEIVRSKSLLMKLVWTAIVVFGCCLTAYQVHSAITEYENNPTTIEIRPLQEEVQYPPMKLCYVHWIYWVNFTIIDQLHVDPETLLYAMSLLTTSYSTKRINIERAEINLQKIMDVLNVRTIKQFYMVISNVFPYNLSEDPDVQFTRGFHEIFYTMFCYGYVYLLGNVTDKTLYLDFNNSIITNELPNYFVRNNLTREYRFFKKWSFVYAVGFDGTDKKTDFVENDDRNMIVPFYLYTSIYNELYINVKRNWYYGISFRVTRYQWMTSEKRHCFGDMNEPDGNFEIFSEHCVHSCMKSYCSLSSNKCGILYTDMTNGTELSDVASDHCASICPDDKQSPSFQSTVIIRKPQHEITQLHKACARKCTPACDQWKYEKSVNVYANPKMEADFSPITYVEILFPVVDNVLSIKESSSFKWQMIIANIGGLLGLWLGASVFSFVQMCYLCCCAPLENAGHVKKRLKVSVISTKL